MDRGLAAAETSITLFILSSSGIDVANKFSVCLLGLLYLCNIFCFTGILWTCILFILVGKLLYFYCTIGDIKFGIGIMWRIVCCLAFARLIDIFARERLFEELHLDFNEDLHCCVFRYSSSGLFRYCTYIFYQHHEHTYCGCVNIQYAYANIAIKCKHTIKLCFLVGLCWATVGHIVCVGAPVMLAWRIPPWIRVLERFGKPC